ncbi:hydroxymyristoyl-ACP dehydratase [Lysinibacillus sp. G4S2]|uniref:hydroxymyristoyl-ACP dehydratase n=1 Tax=Lysinibacillus sp. G4S2 TaxID=3055859 RepID=UPI0025A2E080|nr:hydroxymyristoyl-ACP dehydratase [Lysinibacillus sp. G4S2]MDM5248299.1 hydroxymyristoyl-ACP dehydratase [Lysinibacillus sp. G4S2]
MKHPSTNILENKEELFIPEKALNKDFCDRLVKKIHKNILNENIANDVYMSYFVIFDQQYTLKEVWYLLDVLKLQANEIIRSKPVYITLSGVILSLILIIASAINTKLVIGISFVQIFALAVLSFNVAILFISYKIEKEYKKIYEVIKLIDYYLIFYKK